MSDSKAIVAAQRRFFKTGKTLDIEFRRTQLKKLYEVIKKYEEDILLALKKDLNKPSFEAYSTEIGMAFEEIKFTLAHLNRWTRAKRVPGSLVNFPSSNFIYSEPYGVTLIMSPWNYPVLLTLDPLVGAIAAGNCAVLKPSNYSPNVSALLRRMMEETYPEQYIAVVEGGRAENQSLLKEKFDFIFFTGSPQVGKLVMEAASAHLTPVCLELGGKSPCIVDETADLDLAARRIVWGKFLNAGQTCVAPDYLMVQESVKKTLLEKICYYIEKFYGPSPQNSDAFPRIINEKHFDRILHLTERGDTMIGGMANRKRIQIAPTILDQVSWEDPVMQEEIFGPVLPVLAFQSLKDAVNAIGERPKPLACYVFTSEKAHEDYVLRHLSFGGGCVNDTIMHLVNIHMPFGGIGDSGMGGYHGTYSFHAFSHKKSIMRKSLLLDLPLRYPPYKDTYYKVMKRIMR